MAYLESEGWEATRTPNSRKAYDIFAARAGHVRLEQCKTGGKSPYSHFGPLDRERLLRAAARAGGAAVLMWRANRIEHEIPSTEWPDGG